MRTAPQGRFANNSKPHEMSMSIYVNDCLWIVRQQSKNTAPAYTEIGTDGTNVFRLDNHEELLAQHPTQKKTKNVATGLVVPGVFPMAPNDAEIGVLYLTYASACYLGEESQGCILPIYTSQLANPKVGMPSLSKASWRRHNGDNQLLENLTYHGNTNGVFKDLPQDFPLEVLTASNFVRYGDVEIPTIIHYLVNAVFPTSDKTGYEIAPVVEFSFTGTNVIIPAAPRSTMPTIPSKTLIADDRFRGGTNPIPPMVMLHSNTAWPTHREVTNSAQFKRLQRTD